MHTSARIWPPQYLPQRPFCCGAPSSSYHLAGLRASTTRPFPLLPSNPPAQTLRAQQPTTSTTTVVAASGTSSGGSGKTPYQGNKRCFGHFCCGGCGRKWMSGQSWANCGQECERCGIMVYPYRQLKLEKAKDEDKIDEMKPHPAELCEMCQKLGYPCTTKTSVKRRR